ncbi:hypothetical protein HanRHA438_Chr13g0622921 [Helianthus annuus]|nr:hypothetical protein HanRHA438_Chr13g0622921 [Helianthus annuus]
MRWEYTWISLGSILLETDRHQRSLRGYNNFLVSLDAIADTSWNFRRSHTLISIAQQSVVYSWETKQENAFSAFESQHYNSLIKSLLEGTGDRVVYHDGSNQSPSYTPMKNEKVMVYIVE